MTGLPRTNLGAAEGDLVAAEDTAEMLVKGRSRLYGLNQFARLKDSWATELERLNSEVEVRLCPSELTVRTPAHTKQLGWYVEFESQGAH